MLHKLFKQPIVGTLKFNMADICHFENDLIAMSMKNHQIFMKVCTQQQIWNWMTVTYENMTFYNSKWQMASILKIVFWP